MFRSRHSSRRKHDGSIAGIIGAKDVIIGLILDSRTSSSVGKANLRTFWLPNHKIGPQLLYFSQRRHILYKLFVVEVLNLARSVLLGGCFHPGAEL